MNKPRIYVSERPDGNMKFIGEDAADAAANRKAFLQKAGIYPETVVLADMRHGVGIRDDLQPFRGVGVLTPPAAGELPVGDVLVTHELGIALAIPTADCAPVVLWCADEERRILALAHAGTAGLTKNILGEAIAYLQRRYAIHPRELSAWIGPCIRSNYFFPLPERRALLRKDPWDRASRLATNDGQPGFCLDIGAACKVQLEDAGLCRARIDDSELDTYKTRWRFYSHRRGNAGRMLTVATWK